jgi:hypothetical protein
MATNKKVTRVGGGEAASQLASAPRSSADVPQSSAPRGASFVPTAEAKGRATKLRLFAVLLWVLAIAAEAAAVYVLMTCAKPVQTQSWIWLGGLMAVDLVLVIVGSSLWKKANRLDPASRAQKARFFIQNQLGVIISVIAFLPLVILVFTNKDLSGKEKGILGGVAAVLLLIAGISSADFNPPSVEEYTEQTQRIEELTGVNHVYWTKSGNRYHVYDDCQHINTSRTDEIFEGTVAQARELKNITELCKTCETRAEKDDALLPAVHDHDHETVPQTE